MSQRLSYIAIYRQRKSLERDRLTESLISTIYNRAKLHRDALEIVRFEHCLYDYSIM